MFHTLFRRPFSPVSLVLAVFLGCAALILTPFLVSEGLAMLFLAETTRYWLNAVNYLVFAGLYVYIPLSLLARMPAFRDES